MHTITYRGYAIEAEDQTFEVDGELFDRTDYSLADVKRVIDAWIEDAQTDLEVFEAFRQSHAERQLGL